MLSQHAHEARIGVRILSDHAVKGCHTHAHGARDGIRTLYISRSCCGCSLGNLMLALQELATGQPTGQWHMQAVYTCKIAIVYACG